MFLQYPLPCLVEFTFMFSFYHVCILELSYFYSCLLVDHPLCDFIIIKYKDTST